MEMKHFLLLLVLLAVKFGCYAADSEVKASKETGFDSKSGFSLKNTKNDSSENVAKLEPVMDSNIKDIKQLNANEKPVKGGLKNNLGNETTSEQGGVKQTQDEQRKSSSTQTLPVKESDGREKVENPVELKQVQDVQTRKSSFSTQTLPLKESGSTEKVGKQVELNQAQNAGKRKGSSTQTLPVNKSDATDKIGDGLKAKEAHVAKKSEGASVKSASMRKESSHTEECDSSSKCTDEKNNLVACLRVPGNESPDLSLLIQNKGKFPLTVAISGPDFVHLEKTKIQLQSKQDGKVKVSMEKVGTGSMIVLTAKNSSCRLDMRDLIGHNSGNIGAKASELVYAGFVASTPTIGLVSLAAIMMMASTCICLSIRRKGFFNSGSSYEKLDGTMPVSAGQEAGHETNEGWDNSWGDGWDDEEAAVTPSKAVTPSLSSKGLASRRFNKESWKD